MWYLSSPTRDRTCAPCIGRQSLKHGTTREIPVLPIFLNWALLPQFFSLKAILKPHPDCYRDCPPFYSFPSGPLHSCVPFSLPQLLPSPTSPLGESSPLQPPTLTGMKPASSLLLGKVGAQTLSILRTCVHREKGETKLSNSGKLLSSISQGLWSVVAAFLLKLSSSYLFYNIYLFISARSYLWHVGSSSTRDQTHTPCTGSMKS